MFLSLPLVLASLIPVHAGTMAHPETGAPYHSISSAEVIPIDRTNPLYPEAAGAVDEAVTCAVRFWIDAAGVPDRVEVSKCAVAFAQEVQIVAPLWRFEPEQIDGVPVAFVTDVYLAFDPPQTASPVVTRTFPLDADWVHPETGRRHAQALPDEITLRRGPAPRPVAEGDGFALETCTAVLFVEETGKTSAARVDPSCTITDAILQVARRWRFAPLLRDGAPEPFAIVVEMETLY